ncbi:MAG TPA: phage holin family protein [Ornithinibacter sp.]|jgi:hypothetical protein|nr:phage holin family protein [Ornithinibacter sp.]
MPSGTSGTERTIGQLVADATHDLQGIVRGEIALAKAEVASGAKVLGRGVGLLVGAGFLAFMGVVFLLHSAAWAISLVLPVWAGYAIVAVVIILIAVVLAILGRKALESAKPAPERAIDQAQQTIDAILGSHDEPVLPTGAPGSPASATAPSPTTPSA